MFLILSSILSQFWGPFLPVASLMKDFGLNFPEKHALSANKFFQLWLFENITRLMIIIQYQCLYQTNHWQRTVDVYVLSSQKLVILIKSENNQIYWYDHSIIQVCTIYSHRSHQIHHKTTILLSLKILNMGGKLCSLEMLILR